MVKKIQSHASVPLRSDGAAVAQPVSQDPADKNGLEKSNLKPLSL
jgi:hypothetical protein